MKATRILASSLFALIGCSKVQAPVAQNVTEVAKESRAYPCNFTAGNISGSACNVPLVAILSNPDKFTKGRIFTYAYLTKGYGRYELRLEPIERRATDFASCLSLGRQKSNDDVRLPPIKDGEIYSVSVAGIFSRSKDFMCAGVLDDFDFQYLFKEDKSKFD